MLEEGEGEGWISTFVRPAHLSVKLAYTCLLDRRCVRHLCQLNVRVPHRRDLLIIYLFTLLVRSPFLARSR